MTLYTWVYCLFVSSLFCSIDICVLCQYYREGNGNPLQYSCLENPWRSLVGCSPGGREESDTTERLHFHFSLSCIGEGNGNPLQCSCLENPRDSRAWWAAVYEVAQSWTQLKRLSSSSSMPIPYCFVYYSLELQCDIESHYVLHLRKRSLELYFQIQISEQWEIQRRCKANIVKNHGKVRQQWEESCGVQGRMRIPLSQRKGGFSEFSHSSVATGGDIYWKLSDIDWDWTSSKQVERIPSIFPEYTK